MTTATGALALVVGSAYLGMGLLVLKDLVIQRRARGWSHFGAAFVVMAFTCGPHHLAHGVHVVFEGHAVSVPMAGSLLLALPAAVAFIGLRVERGFGGRGDRLIAGDPAWLSASVVIALVVSGGLLVLAAGWVAAHGFPVMALPSIVLAVCYVVVGWCYLRTQTMRRGSTGGWSLSGVALGWIFPTCALMHLMLVASTPDVHLLVVDLAGMPGALYFLWAVSRLYRRALRDWSRTPVVGPVARTPRPAPWSVAA